MDAEALRRIFLVETEELVSELEMGLVDMEGCPEDSEILNRIFRAAHTLKSSAGIVGLHDLVPLTHALEGVLDRLRKNKLQVTRALVSCLLSAVDAVKVILDGFSRGDTGNPPALVAEIISQLGRFRGLGINEGDAPLPAPTNRHEWRIYRVRLAFDPGIFHTGQAPELLLIELASLGEILKLLPDTSRIPDLAHLDPHLFYLAWTVVLKTRRPLSSIENVFLFVMDDNPIEIVDITSRYREGQDLADADKLLGQMLVEEGYASQDKVDDALAAQKRTGEILVEAGSVLPGQVERLVHRQQAAREARLATTIRVDIDKLDRLVNLVGEMVISVSRASGALRSVPTDETQGAAEALEAIGRQMQDQVMMLRMVPVEGTFARFQRVVRDLSQELGRQIRLVTEGNETELDKSVIERLVDPLKHLVRNAACHGIEPSQERLRKGKPAEGTIVLRARQQSGSIYVEVEDDGRGLDRPSIAARAREMGLLQQPDLPPDAELLPLMFEPGFSTATEVSEIAGRGVGLDVVRRNIQDLRGHIQVRSVPSSGTCFQLRLPLTLAIIDTITVCVGGSIFCIPMLSVIEQFRPAARDLRTVEGRGEVVMLRGDLLPMVRLHRLFDLPDAQADPTRALVVVVENGSHIFALLVDDVLAQAQAVIKPLDINFRRVPGFSGATILGDGRPSLILDIDALQRIAFRPASSVHTSSVLSRPSGSVPTQETPCLS